MIFQVLEDRTYELPEGAQIVRCHRRPFTVVWTVISEDFDFQTVGRLGNWFAPFGGGERLRRQVLSHAARLRYVGKCKRWIQTIITDRTDIPWPMRRTVEIIDPGGSVVGAPN